MLTTYASILVSLGIAALSFHPAIADHWAVLVCGSSGYGNYRHHADMCHAYQILVANGMNESNIITFLYNDVAQNPENPYPNTLFNKPTSAGDPGIDVYKGCKISYSGENTTASNFLAVLTGNTSAIKGGSGEVLKSTADDNVFLNFVDHGGPGILAMPAGPYLYAPDLLAALATMKAKGMYNRLTFYVEACESGSMFVDLPTTDNIYVTTASNPEESSWGTYCPPDDMVNGQSIGSCLGDLYSVSWMENTDEKNSMKETLQGQYKIVRDLTNLSHVMQYGEVDWTSDILGHFMSDDYGRKNMSSSSSSSNNNNGDAVTTYLRQKKAQPLAKNKTPRVSSISSRFATLASLEARAAAGSIVAKQELVRELRSIEVYKAAFAILPSSFSSYEDANTNTTTNTNDNDNRIPPTSPSGSISSAPLRITQWSCYKEANEIVQDACGKYTDYTLMYTRTVAQLCEALAGDIELVASELEDACEIALSMMK